MGRNGNLLSTSRITSRVSLKNNNNKPRGEMFQKPTRRPDPHQKSNQGLFVSASRPTEGKGKQLVAPPDSPGRAGGQAAHGQGHAFSCFSERGVGNSFPRGPLHPRLQPRTQLRVEDEGVREGDADGATGRERGAGGRASPGSPRWRCCCPGC